MLKRRQTVSILDKMVVGAGSLCLLASLAAEGGRWDVHLDLLTHFAPLWLCGSVLTIAWAFGPLASGARWPLLAVGLAGTVFGSALVLPEILRPIGPVDPSGAGHRLKVIQFNAWDENRDASRSVGWLVAQKPDLILMQEITPLIRQGLVQSGFSYTRTMGHTAIFSKATPARTPVVVPMRLWPQLPTFTRATFNFQGASFSVLSVHMDRRTADGDAAEVRALAELASLYPPSSLIIGGDFNMTPWSFAMARLDQALPLERRDRALATWPALLPWRGGIGFPVAALPIDHLYAGSTWRTVSILRGPRLGSDHYPVIMTLSMP
jgi:endonuclease/exonuclease/phosphatase (EEP) superfamily protein YafD